MAALDLLFDELCRRDASDLHLADGAPPHLRVDGSLRTLEDARVPMDLETSLRSLVHKEQWRQFRSVGELDFAHSLPDGARLRVNYYRHQQGVGAAFRRIPEVIRSCRSLGVPDVVAQLADAPNGLVLLTGPTGSGKSTTMASLIDRINARHQRHVITIEEPIEYLHVDRRSRVLQREIPAHSPSFAAAVRAAMRQDPDVMVVGELRDVESTRASIEAADRGVLVFATLHSNGAADSVDRIVDMFSDDERDSARSALASSLRGVVGQQLLRRRDGRGRIAIFEVLVGSHAVSAMVRAGDAAGLFSHVQSGAAFGMRTLDQALAQALEQGLIDRDEAVRYAHDKATFRRS